MTERIDKRNLLLHAKRFLRREMDVEEREIFIALLRSDPEALKIVEPLLVLYKAFDELESEARSQKKFRRKVIRYASTAAAILLLTFGGLFTFDKGGNLNYSRLADSNLATLTEIIGSTAGYMVDLGFQAEEPNKFRSPLSHLWMGEFEKARWDLDRLELENRLPGVGWYIDGLVALYGGEYEEARLAFSCVDQTYPIYMPSVWLQGLSYLYLDEPQKAREWFAILSAEEKNYYHAQAVKMVKRIDRKMWWSKLRFW